MADPQVSPISQLLHTLGITREDLNKRSDQMRQFLTADNALASRVTEGESGHRSRSSSDLRPGSRSTTSSSALSRSLSRGSTSSLRDATPPATPIKSEPHEGGLPHRHFDNMEMVIERQRRQSRREKKSRREKERDLSSRGVMPHPPSPSPSNASQSGFNLDTFMQSRDDRRGPIPGDDSASQDGAPKVADPPPVTPQKNKYYRDHTNVTGHSQSSKEVACKTETPTPTRPAIFQTQPAYYGYPYMAYPHLPMPHSAQANSSTLPLTPQPQRIQARLRKAARSPLPPSSPPATSPLSSPSRRLVNLVSSPGPMEPLPSEDQYDNLPYKLPPGPYSPNKPDLSYAALVGQAILSSPGHRLTLQEIYDWITIVHPYYKRGETTWMNSIRHVLSTTVCFRKVPRERAVGRTLWAIWDEDLECFKGGGFRKQLCKDIINGNDAKEKQAGSAKPKAKSRKRADQDDDTETRKTKRAKKDQSASINIHNTMMAPLVSHPYFPPTRPTPHHQSYYETCLSQHQTLPAEIIFPPLPAAAAFNRVVSNVIPSSSASNPPSGPSSIQEGSLTRSSPESVELDSWSDPPPSASISSASSAISVPELTPNRNSLTPPSSLPTSDIEMDIPSSLSGTNLFKIDASVTISGLDDDLDMISPTPGEGDEDDIFNTSLLGPVQFWGESPKEGGLLQPGIELLDFNAMSDGEDTNSPLRKKGEGKQANRKSKKILLAASPTLNRRHSPSQPLKMGTQLISSDAERSTTPPPSSSMIPSTPPRTRLQISSIRTPISHKGLHMSPSASLAHYKSNLDPPPAMLYGAGPSNASKEEARLEDEADPMRTPRKRTSTNGAAPVTPKRLMFSTVLDDSPFRTPFGISPFRTPGSRSILDPHDPRTVLDDELNRMNAYDDSPAGIFGKGTGSLLYDSPGAGYLDSPGKWSKSWW